MSVVFLEEKSNHQHGLFFRVGCCNLSCRKPNSHIPISLHSTEVSLDTKVQLETSPIWKHFFKACNHFRLLEDGTVIVRSAADFQEIGKIRKICRGLSITRRRKSISVMDGGEQPAPWWLRRGINQIIVLGFELQHHYGQSGKDLEDINRTRVLSSGSKNSFG